MRMVTEQNAFLTDFALLIQEAQKRGFEVSAGELLRTPEQQKIYFDTGRSKTLDSNHLKKLAGDLNFFKDGKWIQTKAELVELGEFWENLNPLNRWGGNFKSLVDCPHFERHLS